MRYNKQETPTFWQWLHKYRAKIGLLVFAIALPITLLLIAFLGPYFSNRSVHFDEEYNDVQRNFVGIDDLKELSIKVGWTALTYPVFSDDDPEEITSHGSYRFIIGYEAKGLYDITSVAVTPVLHTDWFPHYSIGSMRNISPSGTTIAVVWDEEFPMTRLLFITITEPNLYLKVEYTYQVQDQPINETAYVMYSLHDLNPDTVS